MVDLRLYKNFNFATGSLVQFMMSVLFMSSSFLINIFLQQVYQFTPSQVGTLMFPQGMGTGLFSVTYPTAQAGGFHAGRWPAEAH